MRDDNDFIVCTHDGEYHADDVFAVAVFQLLRSLRGKEFTYRRSRNPEIWALADVVVDVGGKYTVDSNGRHWYDHHQLEGAGSRSDSAGLPGTPYASFGLVWKDMGKELVTELMRGYYKQLTQTVINRVWAEVDRTLVEPIDAADNGLWPSAPSFSVSEAVYDMNKCWNEAAGIDHPKTLNHFRAALELAAGTIVRRILRISSAIAAEDVVKAAYATRDHPAILVMSHDCPWQKCLLEILDDTEVKFVIHRGEPSTPVYIHTVPTEVGGKTPRTAFPVEWAGLPGSELDGVAGVRGSVFCHRARFIAGARSYDTAIEMAKKAILAAEAAG